MPKYNAQGWQNRVDKMPVLLENLQSDNLRRRDEPGKLPDKGIYAFYENGKAVYVGRTDRMKTRIKEHGGTTKAATFAYLLAKEALDEQGIVPERKSGKPQQRLTNSDVDKHPWAFNDGVTRVRNMEFRVVEVTDAIEQTLFEVYAALQLGTMREQGGYNSFDNH